MTGTDGASLVATLDKPQAGELVLTVTPRGAAGPVAFTQAVTTDDVTTEYPFNVTGLISSTAYTARATFTPIGGEAFQVGQVDFTTGQRMQHSVEAVTDVYALVKVTPVIPVIAGRYRVRLYDDAAALVATQYASSSGAAPDPELFFFTALTPETDYTFEVDFTPDAEGVGVSQAQTTGAFTTEAAA